MEDSTSGSGELVVTRERERAATSRISNVGWFDALRVSRSTIRNHRGGFTAG